MVVVANPKKFKVCIAPPCLRSGTRTPLAPNRLAACVQTELCPHWEAGGCSFGAKCKFAHGQWELTKPEEHKSFKTQLCKNYWAVCKRTPVSIRFYAQTRMRPRLAPTLTLRLTPCPRAS